MSAAARLPIYEEILLLALDDDKGTTSLDSTFGTAMGGAMLAELAMLGAITIGKDKKREIKAVRGVRPDDPLLAADREGWLLKRMEEAVDGEYQAYQVRGGEYTREHFFGKYPELRDMVATMSDKDIWRLNRGGHDPHKIYAAYASAVASPEQPTVILAKTPDFKTMVEEIFGPVLTVYVYKDADWETTLELVDRTSPYGLTGAVFAEDRKAVAEAQRVQGSLDDLAGVLRHDPVRQVGERLQSLRHTREGFDGRFVRQVAPGPHATRGFQHVLPKSELPLIEVPPVRAPSHGGIVVLDRMESLEIVP